MSEAQRKNKEFGSRATICSNIIQETITPSVSHPSTGGETATAFEAELAAVISSSYELSYVPTILMTERCVVVAANKSAKLLLSRRNHAFLENQALRFEDPSIEFALKTELHRRSFQSSGRVTDFVDNQLPLRKSVLAESKLLRLNLIEHSQSQGRSLFLVQLEDVEKIGSFQLEILMDHDLTPSESKIVLAIYKGTSLVEYAATSNIALSTARTHLQRSMSKLFVNRQAQLVSFLANLFNGR